MLTLRDKKNSQTAFHNEIWDTKYLLVMKTYNPRRIESISLLLVIIQTHTNVCDKSLNIIN